MFYLILIIFFILPFYGALFSILWEENPILTTVAIVFGLVMTYIEESLK